jgi:hypothetical protein
MNPIANINAMKEMLMNDVDKTSTAQGTAL